MYRGGESKTTKYRIIDFRQQNMLMPVHMTPEYASWIDGSPDSSSPIYNSIRMRDELIPKITGEHDTKTLYDDIQNCAKKDNWVDPGDFFNQIGQKGTRTACMCDTPSSTFKKSGYIFITDYNQDHPVIRDILRILDSKSSLKQDAHKVEGIEQYCQDRKSTARFTILESAALLLNTKDHAQSRWLGSVEWGFKKDYLKERIYRLDPKIISENGLPSEEFLDVARIWNENAEHSKRFPIPAVPEKEKHHEEHKEDDCKVPLLEETPPPDDLVGDVHTKDCSCSIL